jgi:two-component system, OmpR family, sensor kinase
MRPSLKSFRWRLQLWHSALLALLLAAFWTTIVYLDRDLALQRVDQELEKRAQALLRHSAARARGSDSSAPRRDEPDLPFEETDDAPEYYHLIVSPEGRVLSRSANAPADAAPPSFPRHREAHLNLTRAGRREIVLPAPHGRLVLVGRDIGHELAELRGHAAALGLLAGGILAAGLTGGWWLATRAIRPIGRIGATAEQIAAGRLGERIDAGDFDSEFHPLARVLNETFARLEAAFARQVRFTADASHELRTPVSVILLQTQSALARERPAADYREALEACQRAAQRMRRLVESLLLLARLDARESAPARTPVDLAAVVRDAIALLAPLAARRDVTVGTALAAVSCPGDADQLGQVVANLLSNALHHSPAGSRIDLAVSSRDGEAVLAVTDHGEGIAADDLPHLFERFHRADKTRARTEGRTGLGLAISRAIVERHGGRIEVASEPGRGSTFTVILPAGTA